MDEPASHSRAPTALVGLFWLCWGLKVAWAGWTSGNFLIELPRGHAAGGALAVGLASAAIAVGGGLVAWGWWDPRRTPHLRVIVVSVLVAMVTYLALAY
jgi:hypothetical protein